MDKKDEYENIPDLIEKGKELIEKGNKYYFSKIQTYTKNDFNQRRINKNDN